MDIPYLNLEGPDCKYIDFSHRICSYQSVAWKGHQGNGADKRTFSLRMGSGLWLARVAYLKVHETLGPLLVVTCIFQAIEVYLIYS